MGEQLLFHDRDDDPTGGGLSELTGGEAPDDDLLFLKKPRKKLFVTMSIMCDLAILAGYSSIRRPFV